MRTDKWLYFRTITDVDDDDGVDGSIDKCTSALIPSNRLITMLPVTDTVLRLEFYSVKLSETGGSRYKRTNAPQADYIDINIKANKHKEVMKSITTAINSPSRTPFITIADDVVTDVNEGLVTAEYVDRNITSCSDIFLYNTPQGVGMHEYFSTVKLATVGAADDVAATLPITLPHQCIILEAALTPIVFSSANVGSVALEYHTAAIANDAVSEGTEIVGADTLNLSIQGVTNAAGTKDVDNTSVPDADLDVSSDAPAGQGIHSGVMDPIATGANATFFHVCSKADLTNMTGTVLVGVYVRWWGRAATGLI